ncbi:MAG: glycosyltransferase [Bacteroidales bacterium]
MHFEHFIITIFCFRGKKAFEHLYWPGFNFYINPFNPKFLEFRLTLFKMFCLPGILSQTNQNFTWIILIDKELNPEIKDALKNLVLKKQRSHILEYEESYKLEQTDWLVPYFTKKPDYVLTSNHDDDDILPPGFVDGIQKHIKETNQISKLPPIKLLGAKQIIQWDLIHSKKSYYGWSSPWHRGYFPSSCGFSLLSKYPETNMSVLGLAHRRAEEYFDPEIRPENQHNKYHRNRIAHSFAKCGDNLQDWEKVDLFFDVSELSGPVLMSNHSRNAQHARLYEKKPDDKKVSGPESFPDFMLDWNEINKNIKRFGKNRQLYIIRELQRIYRKLKRHTKRYLTNLRNLTI